MTDEPKRKMLITNCPNCGGELQSTGECKYCGTHVRFENELNISAGERVEILIKKTEKHDGKECISLVPFRGFLTSIDFRWPELECADLYCTKPIYIFPQRPTVRLEFEGTVGEPICNP